MKCSNCNHEIIGDFTFCPNCGAKVENEQPESSFDTQPDFSDITAASTFNAPVFSAPDFLKCGLFLTVCILQSIATALPLFSGNISVISILFTIFLWLAYYNARKNTPNTITNMRSISGTLFAQYVINWVLCGLSALCGILFVSVAGFIGKNATYLDSFRYDIRRYIYQAISESELGKEIYSNLSYLNAFTFATLIIIAAFIFIIIAIVLALFNIFGTRSIHKFAQSLYRREAGVTNTLVKLGTAKNWMLVFGIFKGISAVSSIPTSLTDFCVDGCLAAIYIIAFIIIGKYISQDTQKNQTVC